MFLSLQKFLPKTTYWYYTEDEKLLKITEISVGFTEDNNLDHDDVESWEPIKTEIPHLNIDCFSIFII